MGHVYLGWLLSCGQQVLVLPRCGGGGWGPPVGPLLRAGGAALFPLPASFLPLGLLSLRPGMEKMVQEVCGLKVCASRGDLPAANPTPQNRKTGATNLSSSLKTDLYFVVVFVVKGCFILGIGCFILRKGLKHLQKQRDLPLAVPPPPNS